MLQFSSLTSHGIRSGSLLLKLLGEPDENSFGTPDVTEPINVLILDHFADELRAAVTIDNGLLQAAVTSSRSRCCESRLGSRGPAAG